MGIFSKGKAKRIISLLFFVFTFLMIPNSKRVLSIKGCFISLNNFLMLFKETLFVIFFVDFFIIFHFFYKTKDNGNVLVL